MRAHAEWKVITHIARTRAPTSSSTRSRISWAALAVVAGDHARDRLLVRDGRAHAHRHPLAGAEPSPPRRVLDLDRHRLHAEQVAGLERPGELLLRASPQSPHEDARERFALAL